MQPNYGSIHEWHPSCNILSTPDISIYTYYVNTGGKFLSLANETPMAYLIKDVNPSPAKPQLKFNSGLAEIGLTSLVK